MLIRKRRKLRDGGSCQHLGVVGEMGILQQLAVVKENAPVAAGRTVTYHGGLQK